jgi:hypothetical protein
MFEDGFAVHGNAPFIGNAEAALRTGLGARCPLR